MTNLLIATQLLVAKSVAYVWVFRYEVIIKEFKQFELSDLTRTSVGAFKVALATLLVTGIWYPSLITIPAIIMALFMLAAQFFHFKIKNLFIKHLPSLILMVLCVFIAFVSIDMN